MNQNNRICRLQGHEQLQVIKVCTFRGCDKNRWCCSYCINDNIHRHSMPNSIHIMNQEQLQNKVKQDIQNLKNQYLDSKQGTNLKTFLQQTVEVFQQLEKQVNHDSISNEDNFKLQKLIQKVEGQNFKQLNDEDIKRLLNINQYQFNYDVQQQLKQSMDKVQQRLIIFQKNAKQQQEKINNIDFKSRQYDIQKIYVKQNPYDQNYIYSCLISRNEQYLVYNINNLIHIYNLKMNKIEKTLKKQVIISIKFQFTIDSKILFAGDFKGFVYGYCVTNGFKTFYKQKIHQEKITQIITQNQYLITSSKDQTILKTNFIKKNQIFKLIGHSDHIAGIDYDILKDIMISISFDKTIKIWDCLNQTILIDHKLDTKIHSRFLQLINNKQDILRGDQEGFQKFAINYKNKKLVEIFSYSFDYLFDTVFYIQSINNDQHLLIIYDQYWIILNKKAQQIVRRDDNFNLSCGTYQSYPQQLDNLNYIILQDHSQLSIYRLDKN